MLGPERIKRRQSDMESTHLDGWNPIGFPNGDCNIFGKDKKDCVIGTDLLNPIYIAPNHYRHFLRFKVKIIQEQNLQNNSLYNNL